MTLFETLNGELLGGTFCVDFNGSHKRTFHLTLEEEKKLWELDESEWVVTDNSWEGTVGDLKDLLRNSNRCNEEQLKRRFKKWMQDSLHRNLNVGEKGNVFLTK